MSLSDISRRCVLFGAAALPASALTARLAGATSVASSFGRVTTVPPPPTQTPATASLWADAGRAGRRFGSAVRMDQIVQEEALRNLIAANCSSVTPEIHLKWNSLEWRRGEFNYAPVDDLLAFCEPRAIAMRGHTLLWERSTPDWARAEILARRDWSTVAGHFDRTLGRYATHIHEWDVVNEPLDTEAGDERGLRRTAFWQAFGSGYVRRALDEARSKAPQARLTINEYGFEYTNPTDDARRRAFLALLAGLLKDGAPLDGVGLQAHLDLAKGPLAKDALKDFVRRIAGMGLDVTVTEMDVKEHDHAAPVVERDTRVADEARRYLDIMLAEPAVRGVSTWGLTDRYSWLSEGDGNGGVARAGPPLPLNRGLPYDASFRSKPLYSSIADAFATTAAQGIAFRSPRQAAGPA